ncbi:MAG: hypothetical protein PVJ27_12030 [Candidatus Brocadiaceae bacterium]
MASVLRKLRRRLLSRDGQGVVEYALILCLVTMVVVAAMTALGESVPEPLNEVSVTLEDGGSPEG